MSEDDNLLDDQAIAWHVRLNDPSASDADRADFARWRLRSPDHAAAYDRARMLWQDSEAPARALGAGGWYRAQPDRQRAWHRALTAGLALGTVLAVLAWHDPGLLIRWRADVASRPGQVVETVLADGSAVVLDRDSAITTRLDPAERRITVLRGRVWFDVAHTGTPFVVRATDAEIRVLGTAFAVDQRGPVTRISVERGKVAVRGADHGIELPAGHGIELTAGQSTTVAAHQPPSSPEPARNDWAWRKDLVVFDRAPLSEVAAALESLRPGRVVVLGQDVRARPVSGTFRASTPDAILDALRDGVGVTIDTVPGLITVIRR